MACTSEIFFQSESDFAARARAHLTLRRNKLRFVLRLCPTQKKLDRIAHPLGKFVRSSKIDGPLTDHGIEHSLHELGEVYHGKIFCYFTVPLTFGDDLAQQAN